MKNSNKSSVSELNSLLQGENMAVDSYENAIQFVQDDNVKNELQKLQQSHKQHTILLADRIQDLGGTPSKGVGAMGRMAEVVTDVRDMTKTNTQQFLKDIYAGTDKGIQMSSELVKGDLDGDSMKLVNNILNDDRNNLNVLQGLMNSIGPNQ